MKSVRLFASLARVHGGKVMKYPSNEEIAEVLGHKTLQMVKRYAHCTEQHTSSVVARMTEKVFGGQ